MSNIYIQEPPTSGKVILHTTVGEIEIELWTKETPKTCRNFIQLLMEGYYNNTIFHRVVKGFCIQGGDPTGTGEGGESIYGAPFKDEFHTRLRFSRRGLVAMANAGKNDNSSQFFFTLAEAPELHNKNTIFGKVVGDTLYNMLRLAEVELDSNERPTYPHKIVKAKIVTNPFKDIIPRITQKEGTQKSDKKAKSTAKATKDFKLLSFGEEAEDDEDEMLEASKEMTGKSKSSHDLLDDEMLSKMPAVEANEMSEEPVKKRKKKGKYYDDSDDEEYSSDEDLDPEAKERREKERRERQEQVSGVRDKLKKKPTDGDAVEHEQDSGKDTSANEVKKQPKFEKPEEEMTTLEKLKMEARQLKRAILGKDQEEEIKEDLSKRKRPDSEKNDLVLAFEAERNSYKDRNTKKLKTKGRERETYSTLEKFTANLMQIMKTTPQDATDAPENGEEKESKVAAQPEKKKPEADDDDDDDDFDPADPSWMTNKLEFNEIKKRKVIDANVEELDRYEIFDPRNPLVKRRRGEGVPEQKPAKSKHKHK